MKSAGENDSASVYLRPALCLDLLFLGPGWHCFPMRNVPQIVNEECDKIVIKATRIEWNRQSRME